MAGSTHLPKADDREPEWTPGPRTDRARRRLLDGAHEAFLAKGYAGARISDITDAAGMSRASFYVYFPSKQDAFLALGAAAVSSGARRVRLAKAIPSTWTVDDLRAWVAMWLDELERFGAFDRLWMQEAPEELKSVGLEAERRHARHLGLELQRLRGRPAGDPTLAGVAFISAVSGLWHHYRRSPGDISRDELQNALVETTKLFVGA